MYQSRMRVYTLGFSLAMSFMSVATWRPDPVHAEAVDRTPERLLSDGQALPDASAHDVQLTDAAFSPRSNANAANNQNSDFARRRYFATRREQEKRQVGGGGYWRWIETDQYGRAGPPPGTGDASRFRYNGSGQQRYPKLARPVRPEVQGRYSNGQGYGQGYGQSYGQSYGMPLMLPPYPATRTYRYQSANGYGYVR
jgi:hypothetical protein